MSTKHAGRSRIFKQIALVLATSFLLLLPGVGRAQPAGDLVIFHAGSLAIPFKQISRAFTAKYPQVRIYREAAGSRTCARKITDLKKPCDVMASADYTVIDNLLIPDYADWNISFATNEMVIMHRQDSAYASEINGRNWPQILLRDKVAYGHSDPNADPCGYRSQLVWQLAEKYYRLPGLYEKLRQHCPPKNIRPKETDLIALLESGELDYLFIYRSVAQQHKMPYVELPAQISLKSAEYAEFYQQASIRISGKKPGQFITKTGKPMVYGITALREAPNAEAALAFVRFVVGPEGRRIMQQNGQPPIDPPLAGGRADRLPPALKSLVRRQ